MDTVKGDLTEVLLEGLRDFNERWKEIVSYIETKQIQKNARRMLRAFYVAGYQSGAMHMAIQCANECMENIKDDLDELDELCEMLPHTKRQYEKD